MNFFSDNTAGASAPVMAALAAASEGPAAAYGSDAWTARVEARLTEVFDRPAHVFLVASGTAANALCLASLTRPWGAVLTHAESHVADDECGAPEFFADGAKLFGLPGDGGKIAPAAIAHALGHLREGAVHQVQPMAISITQATECGLIYTPAEIAALKAAGAARGLKLHMDGARFANALVALGCSPAEITWKAGVDALSFGGTKNGAWAAEAIVMFDEAAAAEIIWRRKRSGHTLSKGRFIAAQFEALLADGHWLDLARHANAMAAHLAEAFAVHDVPLAWPRQANAVFPILSPDLQARFAAAGVGYHPWSETALPADFKLPEGAIIGRFVMSFATESAEVDRLIALLPAPR